MCGRYASTRNPAKLAAEFDAVDGTDGAAPNPDHNVAPTKRVMTVVQRHPRDDEGEPDPETTIRSVRVMKWGLVPNWAKDPSVGSRMINARADTAATKPAFRSSLKRKRCIVPADGWYEWKREGKSKQPFYMTPQDGASLAMAGLWSTWRDKSADEDAPLLITCTVLTTDAVGPIGEVHDRMPLLLPPESWANWLDPDREDVTDLLVPPTDEIVAGLELRPVSSLVNNVRNNGAELLDRVDLSGPAVLDLDLDPAPSTSGP